MRDEKELLEKYRISGDLRLLGALYEPYMPLLYGVCFRYFQDSAQSEDAVMQIFEALIPKLRQHEVHHFKSWLYVFAKNYCLMELRKNKRIDLVEWDEQVAEQSLDFVQGAPDFPDGPDRSAAEQKELDLGLMEACLQELPEAQQICVQLFYLDQRCYKDIAEQTGFSLNKVKSAIQNGKRNLKICMERKRYGS